MPDLNRSAIEIARHGGADVWAQCTNCGTTLDVPIVKGHPRHARVTTNGTHLFHTTNGVARCMGRLRLIGAPTVARRDRVRGLA